MYAKIKILFLVLVIIMPLASQAKNKAKSKPVYASKRSNIAINGYDPVAYFAANKAQKGNKKLSFIWRGSKWLFSSEQHRSMFVDDPERYAPQYGGWCAYAMSDGRTVSIDPQAFEIYQGKLYFNYSKSVLGHWRQEKDLFIQQADDYYPNVVALPE
jgi:YHS domain-containing protein